MGNNISSWKDTSDDILVVSEAELAIGLE